MYVMYAITLHYWLVITVIINSSEPCIVMTWLVIVIITNITSYFNQYPELPLTIFSKFYKVPRPE